MWDVQCVVSIIIDNLCMNEMTVYGTRQLTVMQYLDFQNK